MNGNNGRFTAETQRAQRTTKKTEGWVSFFKRKKWAFAVLCVLCASAVNSSWAPAAEHGHEGHSHTTPEEIAATALWSALALVFVLLAAAGLLLGAGWLRRRAQASRAPCPGCGLYYEPGKDAVCPACGRRFEDPPGGRP